MQRLRRRIVAEVATTLLVAITLAGVLPQLVSSAAATARHVAVPAARADLTPSATTLAADPASGNVTGQPVTLTATVSPSDATGTVEFFDGLNNLGTADVSAGQATLAVPTFDKGNHSLTALYSGDSTYASSASSALVYQVAAAPTVSMALPTSLVVGASPTTFTGTLDNPPDGADLSNVRLDFSITGIDTLDASQLTLQYQDSEGNWQTIPLSDLETGAIIGSFGPATGFPLPAGQTNTTTFRVAAAADAPTGTATVDAAVDTVDGSGAVTSTLATTSGSVDLVTPAAPVVLVDLPSSLTVGVSPTSFTGTLANPGDGIDWPNVRLDFQITGIDTLDASQLTLEYQDGEGKWQTIPLSDIETGAIIGSYGPPTGFALPAGQTNTTDFRVAAAANAPLGTANVAVEVDTVDPESGEVTGTLASTSGSVLLVGPTTTALTSSANPSTEGQSVTFTALVTSPNEGPPPTGTVQFKIDGTNAGSPVAVGDDGTAMSSGVSTLTVGDHDVTAVYSGDDNHSGSTSETLTQTVHKSPIGAYVDAAYHDLLGRAPSDNWRQFWIALLTAGLPRMDFTTHLATSAEAVGAAVTDLYQAAYGEPGTPAHLAAWVDRITSAYPGSPSLADAAAAIFGSSQAVDHLGGGDLTAWVQQLYVAVIHRSSAPPANDANVQTWVARAHTYGTVYVARGFYQSMQAATYRAQALYTKFIGHPATTTLETWAARDLFATDLYVSAALTATDTYFDRTQGAG